MRVLLVYAHPLRDSLNAKIKEVAEAGLATAGHDVDVIDLYEDEFDPVLSHNERRTYFEPKFERENLAEDYAQRLMDSDGLVFVFPTWSMGPPAILKGFFDRVFGPDVSFRIDDNGTLHPNLRHIVKAAAIVTYGRERPILWWFGDPPRRMIKRWLKWFLAPKARVLFLGLYKLHKPDDAKTDKFLSKVRRTMANF
ncbi:MAG: NAD(P)H dehydrogenase [Rhodospirillaceae bacterium]|nr:NAD(P)H dehydrogenase [Rhodospirillaceae bacterium]|tara:strand:- start:31066 stop:31653 length:588 start_codon:yes stop_codon:yes gene_type:complete